MFSAVFEPGVNMPYVEMSGVRKAHMLRPHSLETTAGEVVGWGRGSFGFAQLDEKVPLSLTFLSRESFPMRCVLLLTGKGAPHPPIKP